MLPPNDRLARAAAEHQLARAETRVEAAVITAMRRWLAATRTAILTEAANLTVTAAGWPTPLAVDAAVSAYGVWRHELQATILPTVAIVMGEAFQAQRRANPDGAFWHQQQYLATVADRLRIWPEGAFEDLRPELLELLADADTIDTITDRIGRVLNIDADTRDLRARISEVDRLLDTPDLDPAREAELRARRRALWNAHDQSLNEWRWKARRIARTETHGAIQYGQLAAARQEEAVTGEVLYKRWLATEDTRTRATHVVADGQMVRLGEKFRVGGFLLDHPGDPITIAPHETINCRCAMIILDSRAVQRELQGPKGSLGEVKPGGRRLGPDDPDAARAAVEAVAAERKQTPPKNQRGEQHGQTQPVVAPAVEPEPLPDPIPDIPDDLTGLSEDDLIGLMVVANSRGDDALFERVDAEFDRRAGLDDTDEDDTDDNTVDDAEDQDDEDTDDLTGLTDDELAELQATTSSPAVFARVNAEIARRAGDDVDNPPPPTDPPSTGIASPDDEPDPLQRWVNAEKAWKKKQVRKWLDAEATWQWLEAEKQWKWLTAEKEWLADPLPTLPKKKLGAMPVGARGWIRLAWKGGGAHIFAWEVDIDPQTGKPRLRFIDPQTGDGYAAAHLDKAKPGSIYWLQVNDLMPTTDVLPMVKPPGVK